MCAHAGDVVSVEAEHETVRVSGVEGVLAAGDVLADAFGLPVDWCQRLLGVGFAGRTDAAAFLALHDRRPVAVAGSARIGDIAGIYGVGTRQSHRRRGAAAAAVSAAIEHDMEAGARWFGLLSSPAAEPFYAGLGFVVVDHAEHVGARGGVTKPEGAAAGRRQTHAGRRTTRRRATRRLRIQRRRRKR